MRNIQAIAAFVLMIAVALAQGVQGNGVSQVPGVGGATGATGSTGPSPSGTGVVINLTSATPTANTVLYRQTANVNATATTTMQDLTGLSATLAAGTYKFKTVVFCTPSVAGGCRYQVAFSGTATSIAYDFGTGDPNTPIVPTFASSFSSIFLANFSATDTQTYVAEGTVVVSVSGTLKPQFAQESASGTSTALAGGFMEIWPVI